MGVSTTSNTKESASMSIYSIYRITNTANQKCYIGWTSRDVQTRFEEHLNGPCEKMVISSAIAKYGKEHFIVEVLYQTLDFDHSREMEGFFIGENNSLVESMGGFGYNVDLGGKGKKRSQITIEKHRQKMLGRKQSDEHKKKKADAIRGEKNGMFGRCGEQHPNFGNKYSQESKTKISESQKRRISTQKENGSYKHPSLTPEQIEKMRKTKIQKAQTGEGLKYKNIVVETPSKDIITLPINYLEFLKSIPLNNFMSKSIKNPGMQIKGYKLISYEINK